MKDEEPRKTEEDPAAEFARKMQEMIQKVLVDVRELKKAVDSLYSDTESTEPK